MGSWLFDSGFRVLDIAASLAAIIGLAIVVDQQIQSRRLLEAQTRPYIYISCRKFFRSAKPMVALEIRNSGNSPAYNLIITAAGNEPFHNLSGSTNLPFVNPGTILNVLPGQRLTYLIGSAAKNSSFPLAQGRDVIVTVTYRGGAKGKLYSENVVLTMSTASFLVESVF